jgi:hypothetical protein
MKPASPADATPGGDPEIASLADSIDTGIDSLYRYFAIEKKNIKKKEVPVQGSLIHRREHTVTVPPAFIPLLFNQKLSLLAGEIGGKVRGSENSRTKTVTMHTVIGDYITHSIVFRIVKEKSKPVSGMKRRK